MSRKPKLAPAWMRWILPMVAVTFGMLLAGVGGCSRSSPAHLSEGKPFPIIKLTGLDGQVMSTQALQGKLVILNVWASWCSPCRAELPSLDRLAKKLDPHRFAVIGLSVDDDAQALRSFLREHHISFANYIDSDRNIAEGQLGLHAYPETFLVGPSGLLVRRVIGAQAWDSDGILDVLKAAYHGNRLRAGNNLYDYRLLLHNKRMSFGASGNSLGDVPGHVAPQDPTIGGGAALQSREPNGQKTNDTR